MQGLLICSQHTCAKQHVCGASHIHSGTHVLIKPTRIIYYTQMTIFGLLATVCCKYIQVTRPYVFQQNIRTEATPSQVSLSYQVQTRRRRSHTDSPSRRLQPLAVPDSTWRLTHFLRSKYSEERLSVPVSIYKPWIMS